MLPYLSLILAVRNDRKTVPGLIDRLLEQDYPAELFEIIVVDGRSSDGTADLVRRRYSNRHVRVRVVDNPSGRVSASRNAGIRVAAGDAMIFLSGHCTIPSLKFLADTAEILEITGAGCLCRPQPLLALNETRMGDAIARARASWMGLALNTEEITGYVDPPSSGATYLRTIFEEVGFFDDSFEECADFEFNERVRKAGILAYSDPRLTVYEKPPQELPELLAERFRFGQGMSRYMRKHPERASVADIAPLGVLLALLLTLFAWSQLPTFLAAILTLPAAMFPIAVVLTSMQIGSRYGLRAGWRAPWVFAAIYLGQGIGLLYEYALPAGAGSKKHAAPVITVSPSMEIAGEADRVA